MLCLKKAYGKPFSQYAFGNFSWLRLTLVSAVSLPSAVQCGSHLPTRVSLVTLKTIQKVTVMHEVHIHATHTPLVYMYGNFSGGFGKSSFVPTLK